MTYKQLVCYYNYSYKITATTKQPILLCKFRETFINFKQVIYTMLCTTVVFKYLPTPVVCPPLPLYLD